MVFVKMLKFSYVFYSYHLLKLFYRLFASTMPLLKTIVKPILIAHFQLYHHVKIQVKYSLRPGLQHLDHFNVDPQSGISASLDTDSHKDKASLLARTMDSGILLKLWSASVMVS